MANVCSKIEGNANVASMSEAHSLINCSFPHTCSWVKVPTGTKAKQESLLAPRSAAGTSCPGSGITPYLPLLFR